MQAAPRPTPVGKGQWDKALYAGAHLAAYRQFYGISQGDLARRMGMTTSAVAKVELREVREAVARRYLNAVDYLWRLRQEIRRAGIVAMQAMRDPDDDATLSVERVLDWVTDEPRSIADITEASGASPDEVTQALADLYLAGIIDRRPEGWLRVAR